MVNTRRFSFEYKQLLFAGKPTGFSVIKDEVGLYKVKWPDGELSKDHYNITWAKQHCVREAAKFLNIQLEGAEMAPAEPADALEFNTR